MIKVVLILLIFTVIYFTAHILLLNYSRKNLDIAFIFQYQLFFIDFCTLTLVYLTLIIAKFLLVQHIVILESLVYIKDFTVFMVMLIQFIYHLLLQLLFQKTVLLKSVSIIITSSMAAFAFTMGCFLLSITLAQTFFRALF